MIAKGSYSPAGGVLQELQVIEGASTAGEAGEDLFPASLLLVAVGKVHKGVLERRILLGQLLEANDDVVFWCVLPRVCVDQYSAGLLEFLVLEDARVIGVLGAALDAHGVAGIEQLLGGGGCEAGAVLKRLALSAGVEGGEGHGSDCRRFSGRKKVNWKERGPATKVWYKYRGYEARSEWTVEFWVWSVEQNGMDDSVQHISAIGDRHGPPMHARFYSDHEWSSPAAGDRRGTCTGGIHPSCIHHRQRPLGLVWQSRLGIHARGCKKN